MGQFLAQYQNLVRTSDKASEKQEVVSRGREQ